MPGTLGEQSIGSGGGGYNIIAVPGSAEFKVGGGTVDWSTVGLAGNQANTSYTLAVTAVSGNITITFGGQTATVAFNASADTIGAALEALSSIGNGNVRVSGTGPFTIEFVEDLGKRAAGAVTATGATSTLVNAGSAGAAETLKDGTIVAVGDKYIEAGSVVYRTGGGRIGLATNSTSLVRNETWIAGKRVILVQASFIVAKRLPVIMTYVINLGVPPLLFLQVLYNRQIYSSSVLIGSLWIAVIGLVMAAYWLLYRSIHAIEHSKPVWPVAGLALLIVLGIGQIYSMNMSLMLRPEVWREMYQNSPSGMQGVHGDPTVTPRWLFVMAGGPMFGGLWTALLSNMAYLADDVRTALRKTGGITAAIGGLLMLVCGYRVMSLQPALVMTGISGSLLHNISLYACAATILLATVVGLLQGLGKGTNVVISTVGVVVAFLAATTAGIVRDGIRDFILLSKGFDVNNVPVYPNWSVLFAFLVLFVIMLGIIVWLLQVMRKATPPQEVIQL